LRNYEVGFPWRIGINPTAFVRYPDDSGGSINTEIGGIGDEDFGMESKANTRVWHV
jgi:hypothetical protein